MLINLIEIVELTLNHAQVVELADTADSKPVDESHWGFDSPPEHNID